MASEDCRCRSDLQRSLRAKPARSACRLVSLPHRRASLHSLSARRLIAGWRDPSQHAPSEKSPHPCGDPRRVRMCALWPVYPLIAMFLRPVGRPQRIPTAFQHFSTADPTFLSRLTAAAVRMQKAAGIRLRSLIRRWTSMLPRRVGMVTALAEPSRLQAKRTMKQKQRQLVRP